VAGSKSWKIIPSPSRVGRRETCSVNCIIKKKWKLSIRNRREILKLQKHYKGSKNKLLEQEQQRSGRGIVEFPGICYGQMCSQLHLLSYFSSTISSATKYNTRVGRMSW
jgi:hypothetical protein